MIFNPERHRRRSTRLRGYDYSRSGAYYVTICTWNRECIFGEIIADMMVLNEIGIIVDEEWRKSSLIRKEIELDDYVIMPNHLHGIVMIANKSNVGAFGERPHCGRFHGENIEDGSRSGLRLKSKSLGSFMSGFQSSVTRRVTKIRQTPGGHVWQRNYYDHVIRNNEEFNRIKTYIRNNPAKWRTDRENPNIKNLD